MTIEIHQPELEALIQERIDSGAFLGVEDVLLQAMKLLPLSDARPAAKNLADFLLSSPIFASGLVAERAKDIPQPADL